MTQFLGLPLVQYFDSNGDPLSGGLLHTYEPGTTTNKASYPTIADAKAATNANANPVVLDSRGEAAVVLAGNTKLLLTTAAAVTIWTQDNVDGDGTILDSNGNEMLEFTTTSSATNHLKLVNAATGNPPIFSATGSDTNIGLTLRSKGTGNILFQDDSADSMLNLINVASAVNELQITNATTGNDPSLEGVGGDTDVGIDLMTKGAGVISINSVTAHVLVGVQTFTASATYTRSTGVTRAMVYCTAGGGGGGGTGTTASNENASAGGGGGGGTAIEFITPGATETVTVGAAGAAGAVDAAGGAGGASSFGAFCSATGGAGGSVGTDFSAVPAGAVALGGIGSGGDINVAGGDGTGGYHVGSTIGGATAGVGGSSFFGGGAATTGASASTAVVGTDAQVYGAGGSGSCLGFSQTQQVGGAGSAGIIYVVEYS